MEFGWEKRGSMDRKKREKIIQKLIAKKKLTDIQNRLLMVSKGERVTGREELGVWDYQMQTSIYRGWINNQVLLYSTGNYIQYPVINHNGKNMKKSSIYAVICVNIYRALSHFAVQK